MRITITSCLLLVSLFSFSQVYQDINGKPYVAKSLDIYQGSPLLFPSWAKANIITASGKSYNNMAVNIDVYQDLPLFIRSDTTYSFAETVREFVITDKTTQLVFKKGKDIDPSLPDHFMQVISAEPVFVKSVTKTVVEVPGYDSGNKQYRFSENKIYYAKIDGTIQKINLSKTDAMKVFADKWVAVQACVAAMNLSLKKEDGWASVLAAYTTL
jgi:hypothetical protein